MRRGFGLTFGALTTISGTGVEEGGAGVEGVGTGAVDGGEEFCCANAAGATTIAIATASVEAPVSRQTLSRQSFAWIDSLFT
jgi:hypothetical protein